MNNGLTFEKIEKTLFVSGIEELVPDGECRSLPIIGKVDGKIVDCFYLSVIVVDDEQSNAVHFEAPTAILKIDTTNQQLLFYDGQCKFHPFEMKGIDLTGPDYYETYKSLYVPVREFAFSVSLTAQQIDILSSFLNALESIEGSALMSVYKETSPEFFIWVKTVLPKE